MTKREVEKFLHSPNIKIGFEVEVIVPRFEKEHTKAIKAAYLEQDQWLKRGGRAPSLPDWARKMGYKAGDTIPDPLDLSSENNLKMMRAMATYFRADKLPFEHKIKGQYQYSNHKSWLIKPDLTIGFSGLEMSSPVLSMWEFLYIVPKVFKHIDKYNCKTTNDCGFHIGISFTDPNWVKELDAIKMGLFVDEKFIYEHFPMRRKNEYAESIHADIKEIVYCRGDQIIDGLERKRKRKPRFTDDHHKAINIEHLIEKNKYIEFRYTGGKDYHKKWGVIKEIIAMYIKAMNIARTDEKQEEYLRMLNKLNRS
jgi:hypothetical protein